MKFGYTILYVEDVQKSIEFYEKAFGLSRRFVHESGTYGELETGSTILSFASFEVAAMHGLKLLKNSGESASVEVVFVTQDVAQAYKTATSEGAKAIKAPQEMPWGQTVGYVQDLNGYYVELATPMGQ